jgi:hypothetical protein
MQENRNMSQTEVSAAKKHVQENRNMSQTEVSGQGVGDI